MKFSIPALYSHHFQFFFLELICSKILSGYDIAGKTGIIYHNRDISQYSNNDSVIPPSGHHTRRYILDITRNIKAEAWVDYDFKTILKHLDSTLFWLIGQIVVIAFVLNFYRKDRNGGKTPALMLIDMEKQELRIGDRICNIQKLDLTLLHLLYEKAGTCVGREEIKQSFWPTDDNANEKIDAHIKTIRKVLKEFPEYKLVTVRGKGYYLTIP